MHSLLVSVDNEVRFLKDFGIPYGPDTPHIVHSLTSCLQTLRQAWL